MVRFIIGEHLPQHIMNSQARRDVWREANIAIIMYVSAKTASRAPRLHE